MENHHQPLGLVSDNNGTAIRIGAGAGNHDVTLLRIDGGTLNKGESDLGNLGFSIKYMGSGAGNLNALAIFTDNNENNSNNDQLEAVTILQDGTVGIGTNRPDLAVESATTSKLAVGIVNGK